MSFEGRDGPPLLAGGEADYRTLIERLPIVTYVCEYHPDGRARLRYVSPFVEQLFGYPAESWLGDSPLFVERLHDDDRERVGAAMRRRFREGERFDSEYRLLARDGRVVWVSDRDALVQTAADGSVWSVGNLIDVTALKEAERAVESGERLGREVIEALEEGVAVVGRDGNVVAANRKANEILGIDYAEITGVGAGRPMAPAFFEDGTPVTGENSPTREVLEGGPGRRDVLIRFEREDGPLWVSANYTPLIEPGATTPHGVVWAISDVTARKRAERRQAAVVELGQRALEGGQLDELMDRAMEVVTETLELPLCALLELSPESGTLRVRAGLPGGMRQSRPVVGMDSHSGYTLASDDPVVVEDWTREDRFTQSEPLRERGMASGVQVRVGRREAPWGVLGAHTPELRSFSTDEVDFLQSVANVLAAAIDRWETEERTRHRALHDALTGLPNRTLFLDRLTHALDRAGRDGSMVAVLFLDIDNFKIVNDSLGHESGDALLRSFAPRLQGALRPSDTVARFGGDEFVVLCEDLETADGAVNIVERVLEGFSQPLHVAGRELFATASIGVALARGQRSADGLLRDADAAMYRAKARGRARYELFDEEMRERVSDRLRTEIALRRAVIDGGLEVHYQPLVSLEDGAIVGAEALMRWHDEERGWVPPVEFIPVAEDSGLIVPMGTWVLEQACREALAWAPGADGGPLEIAVNLSSRQVAQPEFGAEVERVVAETGIDPARLTFEITESVVMEEAEAPMESIRRIEDLGVKLALDDFGTGYSSLSYLDRLPIDILKLDRSFIAALAGMRGSPTSAIVAGVVTMAKALGLVVVAEGVEEPDQVQELRRLGCAFAQGFLFSPAVPAAEFRTLLGTAFDVDEPAATGT